MPRAAMSAAARSRLQSGAAVITEPLMWSPTRSLSGSSPRPIETSTSRSLMIARTGRLLVDDDRSADALVGHHPRRLAQRVARADGQHHLRHAFPYFHLSPVPPFLCARPARLSRPVCADRLNPIDGLRQASGRGRRPDRIRAVNRPRAKAARTDFALALPSLALLSGATSRRTPTLDNGRQLFIAKCGTCHYLSEAGTTGDLGPDLDAAFAAARDAGMDQDTIEGVVGDQIEPTRARPTPTTRTYMPADLVTGKDADDVAAYVGSVAGVPGIKPPTAPGGPGGQVFAEQRMRKLPHLRGRGVAGCRRSEPRRGPAGSDPGADRDQHRRPERRHRQGLSAERDASELRVDDRPEGPEAARQVPLRERRQGPEAVAPAPALRRPVRRSSSSSGSPSIAPASHRPARARRRSR